MLCVLFSISKSQPSTDIGFVGNLICPFAMAIWLPIDIQLTNAMLATPPTSAPCNQKNKVINLIKPVSQVRRPNRTYTILNAGNLK